MNNQLSMLRDLDISKIPYSINMLLDARSALGELKGACYGLPNPRLLLSPSIIKEALESSEIENVVTTLADALRAQLFNDNERSAPDKEVLNYQRALSAGENVMTKSYLGSNAILAIHRELVPSEPDYRRTQNYLRNSITGEIVYTPVSANVIGDYISDLEKFINNEQEVDPVLKTIIAHHQFEAIHPFDDGNGRTGRILIMLSMMNYELLDLPVMFISEYINNNKANYYRTLRMVTTDESWEPYVDYMLQAILVQARKSTRRLLTISELHDETRREIRQNQPNIYSRDLVDALFSYPMITATKLSEAINCSYPTAAKYLRILEQEQVLASSRVGKYTMYSNVKLLSMLRNN